MGAVTQFSDVLLRKDWAPRHRNGFGARSLPVSFWLHHTVTAHLSENASVAQEREQMRVLENIGQQNFGGGISYNWILFPSGRLWQGIGVRRRGAHTLGHNVTGMAVALAGNYTSRGMTRAQMQTLAWLIRFADEQGWIRNPQLNGGHRDAPGNATACPGNAAHQQIGEVNRMARTGSNTPSTGSGGGSSSSTTETGDLTNRHLLITANDRAAIRNAPDSTKSTTQVGRVGAGHLVRRDPDRDTTHFYGVGDRWFVGKSVATPTRSFGPQVLVVGDWPGRALPINGVNTYELNMAWRELLARIGIARGNRARMIQTWLHSRNYDAGPIDGIEGPRTIRALQRYLRDQGHQPGRVDGIRGDQTRMAEKRFLNSQRQHLKSRWPQHYRAAPVS